MLFFNPRLTLKRCYILTQNSDKYILEWWCKVVIVLPIIMDIRVFPWISICPSLFHITGKRFCTLICQTWQYISANFCYDVPFFHWHFNVRYFHYVWWKSTPNCIWILLICNSFTSFQIQSLFFGIMQCKEVNQIDFSFYFLCTFTFKILSKSNVVKFCGNLHSYSKATNATQNSIECDGIFLVSTQSRYILWILCRIR